MSGFGDKVRALSMTAFDRAWLSGDLEEHQMVVELEHHAAMVARPGQPPNPFRDRLGRYNGRDDARWNRRALRTVSGAARSVAAASRVFLVTRTSNCGYWSIFVVIRFGSFTPSTVS